MLYGLLPIIENAIAGLEGVHPAASGSSRGHGLSPLQVLRHVELAAPIIVAGIRTSVIINIGTATIVDGRRGHAGYADHQRLGQRQVAHVAEAIVVGLFAILMSQLQHLERHLRFAAVD